MLPTAWVVEPVGTTYRGPGYKCRWYGGRTTLMHTARVRHQLESYVSKLPGLPWGSDLRGLVWVYGRQMAPAKKCRYAQALQFGSS